MFARLQNLRAERTAARRMAGLAAAFAFAAVALVLTASSANAGFSGANGKIAFTRCEDAPNCKVSKIWTANADGTGAARLLSDSSYQDSDPRYSADGRRVAFRRCIPNGTCGIATVDARGNGLKQLTSSSGIGDNYPAFSPDGSRVIFGRDGADGGEIWIMGADGSNPHALTTGPGSDSYPASSPDGSKIAYEHYLLGSGYHIWVMNADGSNRHALTSDPNRRDYDPEFSPDGRQIAFAGRVTGGIQAVWIMAADGTGAHQVTSPSTRDDEPDFSPDGKRIVFERGPADGPWHLYTQALAGGSATQVTGTFDFRSSWSRVPTPSIDSPPTIAGVARAGHALTAKAGPGSWGGTASFQWFRCAAACSVIQGATAATYKPTNADVGSRLQVRQTQTSAGGSVSAVSTASAPVAAEPGVTIANTLVRWSGGRLLARLSCPVEQSVLCGGRLTLTARVHGRSVKIAAGSFQLAAGTTGKLTLRASKKVRTSLAKTRMLTAALVTRDDAGNTTKSKHTVSLKRG